MLTVSKTRIHERKLKCFHKHRPSIDYRKHYRTISHEREMMDHIQTVEFRSDSPCLLVAPSLNQIPMFPIAAICILQKGN